jgi:hypothetical protein
MQGCAIDFLGRTALREGLRQAKVREPKGMRWRTFERLTAEHKAFVRESLAGMARQLEMLNANLGGVEV